VSESVVATATVFQHLFIYSRRVSQAAGQLQGLMSGDLGTLGRATLTRAKLDRVLDVVVPVGLKHLNDIGGVKKNTKVIPVEPNEYQQSELELLARLLASAQRIHVREEEWTLLYGTDPTDALIETLREHSRNADREYLRIPLLMDPHNNQQHPHDSFCIVESPFYQRILLPLYTLSARAADLATSSYAFEDFSMLQQLKEASSTSAMSKDSDYQYIVPFLKIICACVEVYPAGDCWISQSNWHLLNGLDKLHIEPLRALACAPEDLAVVVHVVTTVLIANGGATGDIGRRDYALIALTKLAEATSLLYAVVFRDQLPKAVALRDQWRNVHGPRSSLVKVELVEFCHIFAYQADGRLETPRV
jgi:hypothetical protein